MDATIVYPVGAANVRPVGARMPATNPRTMDAAIATLNMVLTF
jgi:hypothetical protein